MPSAPGSPRSSICVRVPATSANLGPGFDAFGLCLALYDEVELAVTAGGLAVDVTGEGADSLPRGEAHLVLRSARAALEVLGGQPAGLALSCRNAIPQSRGLGSSSAAIVAGVLAARALVPDGALRLDDDAVLALAAELEGHPDNVAACLRGGVTLAWRDADGVHATTRRPHAGLVPVVFVPVERSSTQEVRGLLPAVVPHVDAAVNAGRAALLVLALLDEPALLLTATQDRLHQGYRAGAMPRTTALVAELRGRGIPAVVSGAGPTVLALTHGDQTSTSMQAASPGWTVSTVPVDAHGAVVLVPGERMAAGSQE